MRKPFNRLFACLVLALLSVALLAGCAGEGGSDKTSNATGTTLASWRTDDKFTKAAKAVEDGKLPVEMQYYSKDEANGVCRDAGVVRDLWDSLCSVCIEEEPVDDSGEGSATIFFKFTWEDGSAASFLFRSSDVYQSDERICYTVTNPSVVSDAMSKAKAVATEEPEDATKTEPTTVPTSDELDNLYKDYVLPEASVEQLVATEGGLLWDADGDGESATYWFMFVDNGDEAPSVMEISRSDGSREKSCIDGCYDILRAWAVNESGSRYVLIAYLAGDYYAHDHVGVCRLVDDGQKLVVDYPVVDY